ncbi:hypothetical protein B0H13DRAFT_2310574 [Mycena leptocephala]|nr:hypothetical protein B0H13DRAFT_2310574 [Mycena leptocephala]
MPPPSLFQSGSQFPPTPPPLSPLLPFVQLYSLPPGNPFSPSHSPAPSSLLFERGDKRRRSSTTQEEFNEDLCKLFVTCVWAWNAAFTRVTPRFRRSKISAQSPTGESPFDETMTYGDKIFNKDGNEILFSAGEIPYNHTVFPDMTPLMSRLFDQTDDCTVTEAVAAMAAMGIEDPDDDDEEDLCNAWRQFHAACFGRNHRRISKATSIDSPPTSSCSAPHIFPLTPHAELWVQ